MSHVLESEFVVTHRDVNLLGSTRPVVGLSLRIEAAKYHISVMELLPAVREGGKTLTLTLVVTYTKFLKNMRGAAEAS